MMTKVLYTDGGLITSDKPFKCGMKVVLYLCEKCKMWWIDGAILKRNGGESPICIQCTQIV